MGVRTLAGLVLAVAAAVACGSESADLDDPEGGSGGVGATTSSTTTTTGSGATTHTGGAPGGGGEAGSGASGGQGAAPSCTDVPFSEPNETEANAYPLDLEPVSDCDSAGGQIAGVIHGDDDTDWYYYRGNDSWCWVNPARALDPADAGIRICAFFRCVSADTELSSCPAGTDGATSPDGLPGCCNSSGFTVNSLNCDGTGDDDAHVFIRVDMPGATADTCAPYGLSYHY